MVAGEASGDMLAADLIRALRRSLPDAEFYGIAGPQMQEEGCSSFFPMEKLSVMGLVEVLGHLPELLLLRHRLIRRLLDDPPDLFIGVDAPDFNLTIEEKMKNAGVPTVHYVSPTVWAWRPERVERIARSVDQVLCLFPFEARFYESHRVAAVYVGHPLFDQLPITPDRAAARETLQLPPKGKCLALLPGSRFSEVKRLMPVYLQTVRWLLQRCPGIQCVIPAATPKLAAYLRDCLAQSPGHMPITVIDRQAREVMTAADAVLVASGTATLEAMLLKRPMVVAYRVSPISYWFYKRMLHTPHVALPNLLTNKPMVPELIQQAATPEALGAALLRYLEEPEAVQSLQQAFTDVHQSLRRDTSARAAEAVHGLLRQRGQVDE